MQDLKLCKCKFCGKRLFDFTIGSVIIEAYCVKCSAYNLIETSDDAVVSHTYHIKDSHRAARVQQFYAKKESKIA